MNPNDYGGVFGHGATYLYVKFYRKTGRTFITSFLTINVPNHWDVSMIEEYAHDELPGWELIETLVTECDSLEAVIELWA
jgi:hypothetical protein